MRPTHPPQPPQPMPPGSQYPPPQVPRHAPPQAPPIWREAAATQAAAQLLCPKCHGALVTYERQGVHIEQCRECRGIWLDRGELDRLIDAEASVMEPPAYQAPARQSRERWDDDDDDRDRGRRDWDDDDDDDRRRRDDARGTRPGRRRSMFGELFEGLIE